MAFLENPLFVLFLHKSWIWWTLGHVMNIFSYWHFHNDSKEYFWSKKISNFMHRFKSAILAIFQFFQKCMKCCLKSYRRSVHIYVVSVGLEGGYTQFMDGPQLCMNVISAFSISNFFKGPSEQVCSKGPSINDVTSFSEYLTPCFPI